MSNEEKKEWCFSKGFWICILIEFILILGISFHHQLTTFPEQYNGLGDYLLGFFVVVLGFVTLVFTIGLIFFQHKTSSIIVVMLTFFVGVILPIYEEYKDEKWQCYDRTTYDYDWNNDVMCINKHGETKWLKYREAKEMAPNAFSGWVESDTKIWGDEYTKELHRLVNEHIFDKNGNCITYYNIFSKDRDAYYGYELLDRIVKLEQQGIEMETDIDDWPHSMDFRFGVRYRAEANGGYLGCLDGCGLVRETEEYKKCINHGLF